MSNEALTPENLRGSGVAERRFDPRSAAPCVYKSTSEETRRAYRRTLLEFFHFVGMKHPADVMPAEVLRWRDTFALAAEERGDRLVQTLGRALLLRAPAGRSLFGVAA